MLSRVMAVTILAATVAVQARERVSCQSNIVSSTVVATFCGHREGNNELLDLLILWRGKPGWFQRRSPGGEGAGGSQRFGGGTRGAVSQQQTYGGVTIAFDANFDTSVVTIGPSAVKLDHVNTVVVDDVNRVWRVSATRWTEPRLPLTGDWNLALAQRSRQLLRDLRCDVPMPTPFTSYPVTQAAVITVCEKLKK
jgi:hypothetical protein